MGNPIEYMSISFNSSRFYHAWITYFSQALIFEKLYYYYSYEKLASVDFARGTDRSLLLKYP